MTDAQAFAQIQKVTPVEAVTYLQARGQLATTYGWQDLWQEEHAEKFTISRVTRADLMQGLQDMITKNVVGDLTRRDFNRDARTMLQEAGWWGKKEVVEPETGEILQTTFDSQRLRTILDTNTRVAYGAGQWERAQRTKRTHPYARYITKDDGKVRPAHQAWHNVTLPLDHEFWKTHWCPNGYRCRCRIALVSQAEYDRGVTPTGAPMKKDAPQLVEREWLNRRTGESQRVPVGIDPGFGFNPGTSRQRLLQRVVQDKLVTLDAPIGAALWRDVAPQMAPEQRQAWRDLVGQVERTKRAVGQLSLVHVVDDATLKALAGRNVRLSNAAVLMRDAELLHAMRDTKLARGAALPSDVLARLPELLPQADVYLDTEDQALVYAIPVDGQAGKIVVRVNYTEKGRMGGERVKLTANYVQTGGLVQPSDLAAPRYALLEKKA